MSYRVSRENSSQIMSLVTKTVIYLSNQFQSFQHSLWIKIPICVLSHSHSYFGFFFRISRIRDSPGSKQLFPVIFADLPISLLLRHFLALRWNSPYQSHARRRQTQVCCQNFANINSLTMDTYTPVLDPSAVFFTCCSAPSLIRNVCNGLN